MAASLPATATPAHLQIRHQTALSGFEKRSLELAERPLTLLTVNLAQELDTECKVWLEGFETETKPTREALFRAHRAFTEFCSKFTTPIVRARDRCRDLKAKWDMQERRRQAAERLEAERIEREKQEAARKAEVASRLAEAASYETSNPALAQAIVQEAEDLEEAPLAPVQLPPAAAPTKVGGSSISYKVTGTISDIPGMLRDFVAREAWDEFRELWGSESSIRGLEAQLRRKCTIQWTGAAATVLNCPSWITPEVKATSSNRSRS